MHGIRQSCTFGIPDNWYGVACKNDAVLTVDGRPYCDDHHPERVREQYERFAARQELHREIDTAQRSVVRAALDELAAHEAWILVNYNNEEGVRQALQNIRDAHNTLHAAVRNLREREAQRDQRE